MKNQPPHIPPLPLSALLLQLEAANLPVDPARAMRLRRVLEENGRAYLGRLPELKYLIAPFIARNAKEQAEIYRIWEEFVAEYEEEWEHWGEEEKTAEVVVEPTAWHYRYRRWLLGAILLPMLAGLVFAFWKGKVEPPAQHKPTRVAISRPVEDVFRPGQEIKLQNATPEPLNSRDSLSFTWRVIDANTGRTIYDVNDFDFRWFVRGRVGQQLRIELSSTSNTFAAKGQRDSLTTTVFCSNPPDLNGITVRADNYEPGDYFQAQLADSIVEAELDYVWTLADSVIGEGTSLRYRLEEPGIYLFQLRAIRGQDTAHCSTTWLHQIQVKEGEKPLLEPLPLQRDTPRQYLQVADWVWALVMLPALISLLFWNRWRRRGRKAAKQDKSEEELAAEYPFAETGPYYIPYQDQESKINVPADFFRIADQLRLREAGNRTVFDGTASVAATVKGGGYPRWREKSIHKPAEYLLLLPYTHEFEQRECLLRRLGDFLAEHEAAITTYYHRGDFRHFWNADHPDGWGAAQLLSRYQSYRLILLGTGHGLIDPYETQRPRLLPDLAKTFHRWPRRLLLTTAAVVDWTWQERLLYEHFLLYPADTEGMRKGVTALNQVEEYEPGQFDKWTQELRRHRAEKSSRYRTWSEVADHRDYLSDDPELFRWLCGLAVAAQPDFRLTIAIGRALGIEVTHDRLLRLSRIPWLAGNSPDPQLRLALLDELAEEETTAARLATLTELEAVASQVQGSFAQTEWVANKAVQQFSLEPTNPAYKQQIRDLRQLGLFSGDQLQELEHGLQQGGPATTSASELPQLDKWLDTPEPQPWFTTDLVWGLLLCLFALIGSLACWDYNQAIHEYTGGELSSWQQTAELDDDAVSRNNAAVFVAERMLAQTRYDSFLLTQEFGDQANNMFTQAMRLREGDYPLADSNRYALEYNRRVKYLNFFLADSTDSPEGLTDEAGLILAAGQPSLDALTGDTSSSWSLAFRHATGLMAFYLSEMYQRPDGAAFARAVSLLGREPSFTGTTIEQYAFLRAAEDGFYFDSLAMTMPVNLATLLTPYLSTDSSLSDYYRRSSIEQGLPIPSDTISQDSTASINCPSTDCGPSLLKFGSFNFQIDSSSIVCEGELGFYLEEATQDNFDYYLIDWGDGLKDSVRAIQVGNRGFLQLSHNYIAESVTPGYEGQLYRGNIQGVKHCDNGVTCMTQSFELVVVTSAQYADFTVSTTRGCAPLEVQFTNHAQGFFVSDWYFDFAPESGDPIISSTVLNPTHTFDTPGTYEVAQVISFCGQTIIPHTIEIVVLPTNSPECNAFSTDPGNNVNQNPVPVSFIRPQMVNVPGGTFTMGDTFGEGEADELPPFEVSLSIFRMGRNEVSFAEFDVFCESTGRPKPADNGWGRGSNPAVNITWYDAISYCNWLSRSEGLQVAYSLTNAEAQAAWESSNYAASLTRWDVRWDVRSNGYRLPTEAEWEYAASYSGEPGEKRRFGNGRDTARSEEINFNALAEGQEVYSVVGDYRGRTVAVGSLGTFNPLGIYDLAGNAEEWCWDWWAEDYSEVAKLGSIDPTGPQRGSTRVLRGGAYNDPPLHFRATDRSSISPHTRYGFIGFRVARSIIID